MTTGWTASFPRHAIESAVGLRLQDDLEAHDAGELVWLRGSRELGEVLPLLHRIPDVTVYTIDAADVLTPLGRRIPVDVRLPAGPWRPLSSMTMLAPPRAALPAVMPAGVAVRLVRAAVEEPPGAVIMPLRTWADWATHAPQVRLKPLKFAVCQDGRTLVIGRPLPAVQGELLVDREGLLTPCGFCWRPAVEPAVLRQLLNLSCRDVAMLTIDARVERIPAEALVAASRGAARASLAASGVAMEARR